MARAVSITHLEAHILVSEWAAAELHEVREVWYPAVAQGFQDHQSGYRQLAARSTRDARIEATGWIMWVLLANKPLHHNTLKRHYLDGRPVGGRARRAALDAFVRAQAAWVATLEKPPETFD